MNTEGTRLKELRTALTIQQGDVAEKISTTQGHISDRENGRKNLSERTIKLICLEDWNGKMVSEQWLKYGQGEMFQPRPNMDEVGFFVEDLLEYDGKGNPLYDMIIEMMKKYQLLDESSKKIIRNYFGEIIKSVAEKKERES